MLQSGKVSKKQNKKKKTGTNVNMSGYQAD